MSYKKYSLRAMSVLDLLSILNSGRNTMGKILPEGLALKSVGHGIGIKIGSTSF